MKKTAPTSSAAPGAFNIEAFCDAYHVGRSQCFEEIKTGRLRSFKVGRRRLISHEAAETWRKDREAETAAA